MIFSILIILFSIFNARYDYGLISNNQPVNHKISSVIRGLVISIITLICYSSSIYKFIICFIIGCSIFWIVFELKLNKLRGLEPLYVGYTSYLDILVRKVFKEHPGLYLLLIKILVLLTSIGILLCLNQHYY